ncbi:hypothetical protein [Rothia sp. 11273D007AR]
MNTPAKLMTLIATTSLLLTACGGGGSTYAKPNDIKDLLNEDGFTCKTLDSESYDKEEAPLAQYDAGETASYIWSSCEITDDSAPYAGASLSIRVAENEGDSAEDIYKNPTAKDSSGTYYVVEGKNWVLLPSSDGEEWKVWMERANKALGGDLVTYQDWNGK